MNNKVLIFMIIFLIIILSFWNKSIEGYQDTEIIDNIASLLNTENMIVTNLTTTGAINANSIDSTTAVAKSISGQSINITESNGGVDNVWKLTSEKNSLKLDHCKSCSQESDCSDGKMCNNNIVSFGSEGVSILGNLSLTGNIKMNDMFRKNQPAGYFGVYAYAYKVPLFYGWNIMWLDHNRSMNLRKNTKKPVRYVGLDMRANNDDNWIPRYLTIFPGYIAKLYYWGSNSTAADAYSAGDYDWTSGSPSGNRGPVCLIYVSFDTEGPYPSNSTVAQLTA